MDKSSHITYWQTMALDDLDTAKYNLSGGRHIAALFFFHLAIEKIIKAHWVKSNVLNIPTFTHDLQKLSSESNLDLTADQYDYLSVINTWNLETRYPDYKMTLYRLADKKYMNHHLQLIETLFKWLQSQL